MPGRRISNRVWWSGVAILCSCIVSSTGLSKQQLREKSVTQNSTVAPLADVLKARRLDIVDKKGVVRIRMEATDNDEVFLTVVRPDMPTPVLRFADIMVVDPPQADEDKNGVVSPSKQKKGRWSSQLQFWNEQGKSTSFLSINNYEKNGEWSITTFMKADGVRGNGPALMTDIQPGRIKYQLGDKEKWLQVK